MSEQAICRLCGEPMPEGEEMFCYHGYSGPCPKPPLGSGVQSLSEARTGSGQEACAAKDLSPDQQFRAEYGFESARLSVAQAREDLIEDTARAIFSVLCEGDGEHSEELDRGLIAVQLRSYAEAIRAEGQKIKSIWCPHCLQSWEVGGARDAIESGKAHELVCEKNPLVAQIAALTARAEKAEQVARVGIEGDNHHNAAICPYCRPTE